LRRLRHAVAQSVQTRNPVSETAEEGWRMSDKSGACQVITHHRGVIGVLPLCVLLMLTASPESARAGPEDELAAVAGEQSEAFTQGDLERYLAVFADDAVLSPPGGPVPRIVGKSAMRTAMTAFFAAFPTRQSVPREVILRLYNNGTVAIRNELRDEMLVDRAGKSTAQKTRFSQVLLKIAGRWLVVEQHNSRVPIPRD
jgi:uncharacterized protein (TIGR02246 family)